MDIQDFENCPLNRFLKLLSGKWKPLILYHFIHYGDIRFSELWRVMPQISKKVLLEHLKDMENEGLVIRKQVNTFPPEVFYGLSDKGESLNPIIKEMEAWINKYSDM